MFCISFMLHEGLISYWGTDRMNWLTLSDRYLKKKLLPLSQNKSNFNPEGNSVAAASHALPWCLCACICLPHPIPAGETPLWKGLRVVCLCLSPVSLPANSSSHQTVFFLDCLCKSLPAQPYFKDCYKGKG